MPQGIGRRRWAIAEGYIPGWSHGPAAAMVSHETACLLNTGDTDAHVSFTIYFEDRDPAGPYRVPIGVQHTRLDSRQAENALLSTMAFPVE